MIMYMKNQTNIPTPWAILALMLSILCHQFIHGVRMVQLPTELVEKISLSPIIEVSMAIIWSGLASWVLYRLIKSRSVALNRALWVSSGFIIYSLLRLMAFTRADYDQGRLPFLLVIIISILFLLFVVYQVRKAMHTVNENA